eukprot:765281-Hanusia_phi.AAC.1
MEKWRGGEGVQRRRVQVAVFMMMVTMLPSLMCLDDIDSDALIRQDRGCNSDSCSSETAKDEYEFEVAACTIFRDEDRFLSEWFSFHLCAGIEHFFMFFDRPSDLCFQEILRPYIQAGIVT